MKNLILLIALWMTANLAQAVCYSPITRINIKAGEIPTSGRVNNDFNTLYERANNLPGDCIIDNTLTTNSFTGNAVTNEKIANATITASKFAVGVFPQYSKPLRIRAFTSNGNWKKGLDVGSVFVQVIAGGGGAGDGVEAPGGNSSFGGLCTAFGGRGTYKRITQEPTYIGVGGGASGGDINLAGQNGMHMDFKIVGSSSHGFGGKTTQSMLGHFGGGGISSAESALGSAGAGGYCARLIQRASLPDDISVTVGGGGIASTSDADNNGQQPGQAGLVLIYEYAL